MDLVPVEGKVVLAPQGGSYAPAGNAQLIAVLDQNGAAVAA